MLNSMLRSFEEESEEERADFPTAPEEAAEEVRRWAEAYPAWPPVTATGQGPAAGQQRVRWVDDEAPLDTAAAEQVARALAVDCGRREQRIAALSAERHSTKHRTRQAQRTRFVRPEEEQPRVWDEQECIEQYA